jgi:hypothetical protein
MLAKKVKKKLTLTYTHTHLWNINLMIIGAKFVVNALHNLFNFHLEKPTTTTRKFRGTLRDVFDCAIAHESHKEHTLHTHSLTFTYTQTRAQDRRVHKLETQFKFNYCSTFSSRLFSRESVPVSFYALFVVVSFRRVCEMVVLQQCSEQQSCAILQL